MNCCYPTYFLVLFQIIKKIVVISNSWINQLVVVTALKPILMWLLWLLTDRLNLPYSCILCLALSCGERVCSVLAQIQVALQLHRWYEGNVVACARPKWCSLAHAYRRMTKLSNHGSHPLIPWYAIHAVQWHAFIQYLLYNKNDMFFFFNA